MFFSCWDGDEDEYWAHEAEYFIRQRAIAETYRTLVFRDHDGLVAAVSAFDKRGVRPNEAAKFVHDGWLLQVVGVRRDLQGGRVESDVASCPGTMRVSEYVFRKTFERMRELDPTREVVTARVHEENRRSIEAARRVGLERTVREDADYWRMLGKADPAIGC